MLLLLQLLVREVELLSPTHMHAAAAAAAIAADTL
jgi:hypothetical protein